MDFESYFQNVDEAAGSLMSRVSLSPRVIVVLSGGLDRFTSSLEGAQVISSTDIPHFPRARAEGHAGELVFGKHGDVPLVAMVGRFHYYEGHAPQAIVFPHFVLAKLGAGVLITTNAVGGINRSFRTGDIMLVTDHLNMMGINPLIGIAVQRPRNQFTSLTNAYDEGLRKVAITVARRLKIRLREGVYLAASGPSYETKAEINFYRQMGADAVGMSTVPEVIAANFLGMRVLSFSCIANPAADLHEGQMTHDEVLTAMKAMAPNMVTLLQGVVEEMRPW